MTVDRVELRPGVDVIGFPVRSDGGDVSGGRTVDEGLGNAFASPEWAVLHAPPQWVYTGSGDSSDRYYNPDFESWAAQKNAEGWRIIRQTEARYEVLRVIDPAGFQVGQTLRREFSDDSTFWRAGLLAAAVVGGAVAEWSAAGYGMDAPAGYGGETFGGGSVEIAPSNIEYSEMIAPQNYSSGESLTAFSDAQNVSYGFDTTLGVDVPIDPVGSFGPLNGAEQTWSLGWTPESSTRFGTTDFSFSPDVSPIKGNPVAIKPAPVSPPPTLGSIAKAVNGATQEAVGALRNVYGAVATVTGAAKAVGSSQNRQKETGFTAGSNRGQYQATPSGGFGGNTAMLLIGAVAIGAVLFVATRKG